MGEIQEFVLPDGRKAIWDETVGGYFIEGTETETVLKGMETVQMKGLHTLAVQCLRQLVQVCFWAVVAIVVKASISIADNFDNYAAKPTAHHIAETFGFASSLFIMLLLLFIVACVLWLFFGDFRKAVKVWKPEQEVVQHSNKKQRRAAKPISSHAQNTLTVKK